MFYIVNNYLQISVVAGKMFALVGMLLTCCLQGVCTCWHVAGKMFALVNILLTLADILITK